MNISRYSYKALETDLKVKIDYDLKLYPIMGMISEIGEVFPKLISFFHYHDSESLSDVQKEIGDVFWYYVATMDRLDQSIQEMIFGPFLKGSEDWNDVRDHLKNKHTILQPLSELGMVYDIYYVNQEIGSMLGILKKVYRGDKDSATDFQIAELITDIFVRFLMVIISVMPDIDFNEVAEMNIRKLHERKTNKTIKGSGDNR